MEILCKISKIVHLNYIVIHSFDRNLPLVMYKPKTFLDDVTVGNTIANPW